MKRIATLFLAIVMLVSVMAPISVFAAADTSVFTSVSVLENQTFDVYNLDRTKRDTVTGAYTILAGTNNTLGNNSKTLPLPAEDAGKNIYVESGTWKTTVGNSNTYLKDPFGNQINHVFGGTGSFKFKLTNIPAGTYEVCFWIMGFSNNSQLFSFKVNSATGLSAPTSVNLSSWGSNRHHWISFGKHKFNGTEDEYVEIIPSGQVRISAMSFVPVAADAIPQEEFATIEAASLTEVGDSATLKLADADKLISAYYNVDYYYTPSGDETTAPVAKIEIFNGDGATKKTHYYNTGDGSLPAEAGFINLGTFSLKDAASVKVTKVAGTAPLSASQVRFTPADATVGSESVPERIADIYKAEPDAFNDRLDKTANDNYRTFLGEASWKTTMVGTFENYSTRDYGMKNGTIKTGFYDVYFYAIADADTAGTEDDVEAYVYHNGVVEHEYLDYSDLTDGTKKWIKIGTYKFVGNSADDFISIGSDKIAGVRLGGVKFVPTEIDPSGKEIIVHTRSAGYKERGTGWADSGSIQYNGKGTRYVNGAGRSAEFTPAGLTEGEYHVYYYHMPFYRNATDKCTDSAMASFVVNHNGVTDGQLYNNRDGWNTTNKFDWKYMGTYDFAGTGDESVVVTNMDAGKSIRAGAVKFVKVGAEEEFVVPGVKNVDSTNFKVISEQAVQSNASDHPDLVVDGMISFSFNNLANAGAVKIRYYLPNYGPNTVAGKYEVSLAALPFSGNDKNMNTVISHNNTTTNLVVNNHKDMEGNANTTFGWMSLGQYDFLGGDNGEYIEFELPAGTTRYSGVKFTLIEAAPVVEEEPELSGTLDCEVTYNNGITSIDGNNNQGIAVTAKVTNGLATDYNDTPVVYAAVYDEDWNMGAWVKLDTYSDNIKSGKTAWYSGRLASEYAENHTVVTYVWDSNLKPLTTTFELPVIAPAPAPEA